MKRLAIVLLVTITAVCFTALAFAGIIGPGEKTTCNNASSITLTAKGTSTAGDRSNANAVIWKSSNFTTIPISLGSGESNGLPGGSAGNKKDLKFAKQVNMGEKHTMGRGSVILKSQENFSRGDSIGDISGEVRIHNTGTVPIDVKCG